MTAGKGLAIRQVLEAAGIEFIDENGGGPGVAPQETIKETQLTIERHCRSTLRLRFY